MTPQYVARLRLLALCVAIACRAFVYTSITVLAITALQNNSYAAYRPGTLAAWLGLCSLPALILSPFIGPLVGSRWNWNVRIAGSILVLVALAWSIFEKDVSWLSVVGILSLDLAFVAPAILVAAESLTPAARVSSTTARCWLVLWTAVGVFSFVFVDYCIARTTAQVVIGVATASLLVLLFVSTPSVERVSLSQGFVKPFLTGVSATFAHRRARHALCGLWLWGFVILSATACLFRAESYLELARREVQMRESGLRLMGSPDDWLELTSLRFISMIVVGILVSAMNRSSYRHAGYVLYSAASLFAALLWLRFGESTTGPLLLLGFALGLAISPLLSFYLTWTSLQHHGVAVILMIAGWCAGALILAAILVNLGEDPIAARTPLLNVLLVITGLAFIAGIASFFRPAFEMTLEVLFWPIYRIRSFGPGVEHLPESVPYLVIGNHAAWFDPLFFAKILPTPIVPMMISKFYDVPVISWIMRHVIGTIRVPDKVVKHDAPELKEAVAALDRGECVVVFPEGYLRRKAEVPLRRFGRGIWQILRDRPQTPLFACWIEGTWGSYLSYGGGPPMKGKRPDFWRSIRIGVIGPIAIDAKLLDDHMATRTFLMQQVSEARRPLGLQPLALPTAQVVEGEAE